MSRFALQCFLEDDDGSLGVTQSPMYIAALACCVAPSLASACIALIPSTPPCLTSKRLTLVYVDDELPSLDEVRSSIDALVADEPIDVNIRQPPGAFESLGRSGTPSVPPGFSFPSAQPSPAISHSSPLATSVGRQTPPVTVPKVPTKSATTASSPLVKKAVTPSVPEAKKAVKALAAESGLSKEIAKAKTQKVLQDEDFPALNSPKTAAATPVTQPKAATGKASASGSKKLSEKAVEKAKEKVKDKSKEKEKVPEKEEKEKPAPTPTQVPAQSPKKSETPKPEPKAPEKAPEKVVEKPAENFEKKPEKRPVPGILNIAAATKAAQVKTVEAQSATDKAATDRDSAFPALPAPTPASVSSPLTRAAPKTLRLVSTPKTETPSTPILATPAVRSVAASAIRPETPVSELISDSASIISASISASRASSPPPSRVGAAPVRTTTKSQQRKQRKEALKKESASIAAQPVKAEPSVEIGPIIGRKKKQKKDKEKPGSKTATPAVSRPETPLATQPPSVKEAKEASEVKEVKEESSTYRSTANETTTLTDEPAPHKARYGDLKSKLGDKQSSDPSTPRTLPTPASVLHELQEAGLVPGSVENLALFKPVNVQLDKSRNDANSLALRDHTAHSVTPIKPIVTEDDQAALLAGKPVHKVVDGTRIMLTPNGDCIRNLNPEEEERFLELQKLVAEAAGNPVAFISTRKHKGNYMLMSGRAVPNTPPTCFPPAAGAVSDPVGKIHKEEVLSCLNQYMLPRVNLSNARNALLDAQDTAAQNPAHYVEPFLNGNVVNIHATASSYGLSLSLPSQLPVDVRHADALLDHLGAAPPEVSYPGPVGAFADEDSGHDYVDINAQLPTVEDVFGPGHRRRQHQQHSIFHHHHHYLQHNQALSLAPSTAAAAAAVATGLNNINGPLALSNLPLMAVEEAEQLLSVARKETEKLEKSLNQLMRKNRRLLMAGFAGGAITAGGASAGGGGH
ncbi:hypothetical protein VTI74DRAFT_10014 [Chaetomium olivicolor]